MTFLIQGKVVKDYMNDTVFSYDVEPFLMLQLLLSRWKSL